MCKAQRNSGLRLLIRKNFYGEPEAGQDKGVEGHFRQKEELFPKAWRKKKSVIPRRNGKAQFALIAKHSLILSLCIWLVELYLPPHGISYITCGSHSPSVYIPAAPHLAQPDFYQKLPYLGYQRRGDTRVPPLWVIAMVTTIPGSWRIQQVGKGEFRGPRTLSMLRSSWS